MTKIEFLELVDKYNKNECTDQEQAILYQFCEKAQLKKLMLFWDLSEEEEVRVRLFLRINATIRKEESLIKRKRLKFLLAGAAVVLLGSVISWLVIQHKTTAEHLITSIEDVPKDKVTLKIADHYLILEEGIKEIKDQGNVIAYLNGQTITYNTKNLKAKEEHKVLVPNGKKINVVLSDGSTVYLNSGTTLSFPNHFEGSKERKVVLNGEAYFDVQKDKSKPFLLQANEVNVKVLGTSFNVSSYTDDKEIQVVLVEGAVSMDAASIKDNAIKLSPGYQGVLSKSSLKIITQEVNTSLYTSWLNGNLIFRQAAFSDILKKLERAYGVDIKNNHPTINKIPFNTNIDIEEESIEEVLQMFSNLADFTFKKDANGRLIINPKDENNI